MVIVVANNLPPAIRGRMKLWFIEPRPNIFVSGINDHVAAKVVDYLYQHCPGSSGLTTFRSTRKPPGYEIRGVGDISRVLCEISGLQLIKEK